MSSLSRFELWLARYRETVGPAAPSKDPAVRARMELLERSLPEMARAAVGGAFSLPVRFDGGVALLPEAVIERQWPEHLADLWFGEIQGEVEPFEGLHLVEEIDLEVERLAEVYA